MTDGPTGPTVVTREDRARGYFETITMSAEPDLDGEDRPTGSEAISNLQGLSRTYTNPGHDATHMDAYFDFTSLSYSTSTSLGTEGVHFHRTRYDYDAEGRQNKVTSPAGTITRMVFDGPGRVVSEWVGINDTPEAGEWSPANPAGMVKVREYEYDDGGIGDSNRTKATEFPGLGADDRVTQAGSTGETGRWQ
jgi:YD repeat-containing protein